MSTSEEIQAVFESDINRATRQVVNKKGYRPLLEGAQNMHVFHLTKPVHGDGGSVTNWEPPKGRDD